VPQAAAIIMAAKVVKRKRRLKVGIVNQPI
jgi:hypothetical protein